MDNHLINQQTGERVTNSDFETKQDTDDKWMIPGCTDFSSHDGNSALVNRNFNPAFETWQHTSAMSQVHHLFTDTFPSTGEMFHASSEINTQHFKDPECAPSDDLSQNISQSSFYVPSCLKNEQPTETEVASLRDVAHCSYAKPYSVYPHNFRSELAQSDSDFSHQPINTSASNIGFSAPLNPDSKNQTQPQHASKTHKKKTRQKGLKKQKDNYLTGNPTLSTVNSLAAGLARPQSSVSQSIGLPPSLLSSRDPHVVILEQPRSRGIRFRYKCEGRSAGSIPGENSTDENRLFPSIKIENYKGPAAIVVVSCVTKDEPHRPHPHTLVGRDCQKGVCTVKLKNTNVASFPSLGIQCMTKREIKDSLKERESIKVDPFGTGFFDKINNLDLNIVRLCFQVFLPDTSTGRFTRIVNPVVSHPIYDKKAVNELVICRLSKQAGHAKGGDEVFMLCEKVNKDDIDVVFYEDSSNGERMWQAYGDFAPTDVHRQFAIVFRTPAYRDPHIRSPKSVSLQLVRKTDGESSDPKPFQYIPDDPDPEQILHKRKRKQLNYSHYLQDEPSNSPAIPTTVSVKAEEEERGIPNIRGRLRGMVNSRGGRRMRGRPPKSSNGQQREMFAPVDDSSNMSAQDYSSISGLNQGFDNELTSVPVTALSAAKAAFTPSSVSHSIMAEGDGGGVGMMVAQGGMPIGMLQPLPGSNVPFSFPPKEDVMLSDLESVTNAANGSCLSLQVSDSMLTRYMVDDMSGQIPNDMSLSFNLTNIDMESAPSDTVAQNVTISSDGGKHV